MPSCVFRYCTNYDQKVNKANGISYHRFPSDEVNLQAWISIVRSQRSEPDWMPSSSSRICIQHFKSEDKYTSKTGLTLLKKDAIPVIGNLEEMENIAQNESPSSLDDLLISDEEETSDTAKKAALKKAVIQLKCEKESLQKKNKLLSEQNKRLKLKLLRTMHNLKTVKKLYYEPYEPIITITE